MLQKPQNLQKNDTSSYFENFFSSIFDKCSSNYMAGSLDFKNFLKFIKIWTLSHGLDCRFIETRVPTSYGPKETLSKTYNLVQKENVNKTK